MATKNPPAPIYTADGLEFEIGMVVYGFDCECKIEKPAKEIFTRLIVSDIDLSMNQRMVRLRKPNGREWRWYAEESRTSCSNNEHLVYFSLEKLKKAAVPILTKRTNESEKAKRKVIEDRKEQRLAYLKGYDEEIKELEEQINAALTNIVQLKNLTPDDFT